MQFRLDRVGFGQSVERKNKKQKKQSFLAVVDPEGVNKQGRVWEAGSSV